MNLFFHLKNNMWWFVMIIYVCDDLWGLFMKDRMFSTMIYQICKNCQSYKQENPFPEYNDCETHNIKVSDYGTCPDFKMKSDK